jgi:hypothetical protein
LDLNQDLTPPPPTKARIANPNAGTDGKEAWGKPVDSGDREPEDSAQKCAARVAMISPTKAELEALGLKEDVVSQTVFSRVERGRRQGDIQTATLTTGPSQIVIDSATGKKVAWSAI